MNIYLLSFVLPMSSLDKIIQRIFSLVYSLICDFFFFLSTFFSLSRINTNHHRLDDKRDINYKLYRIIHGWYTSTLTHTQFSRFMIIFFLFRYFILLLLWYISFCLWNEISFQITHETVWKRHKIRLHDCGAKKQLKISMLVAVWESKHFLLSETTEVDLYQ